MRAVYISRKAAVTIMARHVLGLPAGEWWSRDWAYIVKEKDQVRFFFFSGQQLDCSVGLSQLGSESWMGPCGAQV